jgi:hypothetical protein
MRTAGWECPCGREKPKRGATAKPVSTLVSAMEPFCGFCGRSYDERIVEGSQRRRLINRHGARANP